jgi:hypothetical protein
MPIEFEYDWAPVRATVAKRFGLQTRTPRLTEVVVTPAENIWVEEPLPSDDRWTVACRVVIQERRAVVAEVRVFPSEPSRPPGRWSGEWLGRKATVPDGGLHTRHLRSIKVAHSARSIPALVERAKRHPHGAALLDPDEGPYGAMGVTAALLTDRQRSGVRGRGRPALPVRDYKLLAADYIAAVKNGSRRPVADLAETSGVPSSTIRSRLSTARKMGFLEQGLGSGVVGRMLMPAAKNVLRAKGGRNVSKKR